MIEFYNNIARSVSKKLAVKEPVLKVVFEKNNGETDTQSACYSCDGHQIMFAEDLEDCTAMVAIIHEVRHIWQREKNEKYYFANYKSSEELSSDEFNLQIAELDANLFAKMYMEHYFNVTPPFTGLSQYVIDKIEELQYAECEYSKVEELYLAKRNSYEMLGKLQNNQARN